MQLSVQLLASVVLISLPLSFQLGPLTRPAVSCSPALFQLRFLSLLFLLRLPSLRRFGQSYLRSLLSPHLISVGSTRDFVFPERSLQTHPRLVFSSK